MKKRIIIFVLLIFLMFYYIGKKITPILHTYADLKAKSLATILITQAVNDKVFSLLEEDKLVTTIFDKEGHIQSVEVNPIYANQLLNQITRKTEELIVSLEKGRLEGISSYNEKDLKRGIIYKVPLGVIFSNSLTSNLGPKIPVRMQLVGDVSSDIQSKVTSYGMNNAFFTVIVFVEVKLKVILPFSSSLTSASTNIPIVMKLIEGDIPKFYLPQVDSSS